MDPGDKASQDSSEQGERELIESITPDVMRALVATGFFVALDDHLCRADAYLRSKDFPDEDIQDVISVMQAHGGYCDCEILYNVVGNLPP
jgi:Protein of unknown function (DUF2695)